MEIRAMRREIYKEPYQMFKFTNMFHFSMFKNRNIRNVTSCKSAVIVFMREDNLQEHFTETFTSSPWKEKINKNIFYYKQEHKPEFKEAVYISSMIMQKLESKIYEEVFIGFKSCKRNKEELILLELFPINKSLSFLMPKYLESIIFGILLETYDFSQPT